MITVGLERAQFLARHSLTFQYAYNFFAYNCIVLILITTNKALITVTRVCLPLEHMELLLKLNALHPFIFRHGHDLIKGHLCRHFFVLGKEFPLLLQLL